MRGANLSTEEEERGGNDWREAGGGGKIGERAGGGEKGAPSGAPPHGMRMKRRTPLNASFIQLPRTW